MLERIRAIIEKHQSEDNFYRRLRLYFPRGGADYKLITRAYTETIRDFRNMQRDGGTPYFGHPEAIAVINLEYLRLRDPILITGSILHDNVEDLKKMGWTIERVANSYNQEVAELVWWVTKPDLADYEGNREERDRSFHARLQDAPRRAAILKLSDRFHNILTLSAHEEGRQRRKIRETRDFYIPLAEKHTVLIHELECAIEEVEKLWQSSFADGE